MNKDCTNYSKLGAGFVKDTTLKILKNHSIHIQSPLHYYSPPAFNNGFPNLFAHLYAIAFRSKKPTLLSYIDGFEHVDWQKRLNVNILN